MPPRSSSPTPSSGMASKASPTGARWVRAQISVHSILGHSHLTRARLPCGTSIGYATHSQRWRCRYRGSLSGRRDHKKLCPLPRIPTIQCIVATVPNRSFAVRSASMNLRPVSEGRSGASSGSYSGGSCRPAYAVPIQHSVCRLTPKAAGQPRKGGGSAMAPSFGRSIQLAVIFLAVVAP